MLIRNIPYFFGAWAKGACQKSIVTRWPSRNYSRSLVTHARGGDSNLSYYHYMGKQPLVYRNVGQQLERAVAEYGQSEGIVSCHEDSRLTFTEILKEADRIAAGLLKIGLQRGDFIAIWGPNNITWYLVMLGAARAGLVTVGLNPAFQAPEIEYCLKKVKVKAVIAPDSYKTQNYYEMLRSICPELGTSTAPAPIRSANLPHLQAVIIDSPLKFPSAIRFDEFRDWSSATEVSAIAQLQKTIGPDTACNVQFTSGTTGQPKAALLSHYNIVNNGTHIANRFGYDNDRICVQVPLFHVYGVVISIMAALTSGSALVLPERGFMPEASLRAITAEECTVIHGTPTMYVDLIRKQKELQLPLSTAKMAITGGAPCSPKLFMEIKEVLGLHSVRTVFGLTETTAVIFQSCPGETDDQILNTVGYIQDHVEAKVIDGDGEMVPFGQPGELCVRGYCAMLGYYDDEIKTRQTIGLDRWVLTGDQFILEADGYGRIVGRLKEMIIRGGENIYPKEVEDVLNTHPDILESHVIGVPDERMGEELCAYVRLADGVQELLPQTVRSFSKGKMAHFKVPRYIVPIAEFPKTTSGKIQKFKLRQMYDNRQEAAAHSQTRVC